MALVFMVAGLAGCLRVESGEGPRRSWSYPAEGSRIVLLQSWRACEVRVLSGEGMQILISAQPRLQPASQHGPEPDWRTTPAGEWSFDWRSDRTGTLLTLSAEGEARLPHHRYLLEELTITVPPGVAVMARRQPLEKRPEEATRR